MHRTLSPHRDKLKIARDCLIERGSHRQGRRLSRRDHRDEEEKRGDERPHGREYT
jgi:hypothetical protein